MLVRGYKCVTCYSAQQGWEYGAFKDIAPWLYDTKFIENVSLFISRTGRDFWMSIVPATGRPDNPASSTPSSQSNKQWVVDQTTEYCPSDWSTKQPSNIHAFISIKQTVTGRPDNWVLSQWPVDQTTQQHPCFHLNDKRWVLSGCPVRCHLIGKILNCVRDECHMWCFLIQRTLDIDWPKLHFPSEKKIWRNEADGGSYLIT